MDTSKSWYPEPQLQPHRILLWKSRSKISKWPGIANPEENTSGPFPEIILL
jgi:hypothetical protein